MTHVSFKIVDILSFMKVSETCMKAYDLYLCEIAIYAKKKIGEINAMG